MRKPKLYVNGMEEQLGQVKEAREILQRRGIYRKLEYQFKHVETLVLEGYEYMIIEREVMSFSLGSLTMSEPYVERVAWFQPSKQEQTNS